MRSYFKTLQDFATSPKLDKRTQFMCRDVRTCRQVGRKDEDAEGEDHR